MGISKNDIIAKSSQIDQIINGFIKNLTDFKSDVNNKLTELNTIANAVQWSGQEADNFKKVILNSKINISNTLNKSDEIIKKLQEKSNQWASIMKKLAETHKQ